MESETLPATQELQAESETLPATQELQAKSDRPAYVIVQPHIKTADGAEYVHADLMQVVAPWEVESHVGPVTADEGFGDVESWAKYVRKYGDEFAYVTWNSQGLKAVIDYHTPDTPDRCTWVARHIFEKSREFADWTTFVRQGAVTQKDAVRFLEDHASQIYAPPDGQLVELLRRLSANSNVSGDVKVNEDGTTEVQFSRADTVRAGAGGATLPPTLTIRIPVLKGLVTAEGAPKWFELDVRMRVASVESGVLKLDFTMPAADATWESVVAERVGAAASALEGFELYRAQG